MRQLQRDHLHWSRCCSSYYCLWYYCVCTPVFRTYPSSFQWMMCAYVWICAEVMRIIIMMLTIIMAVRIRVDKNSHMAHITDEGDNVRIRCTTQYNVRHDSSWEEKRTWTGQKKNQTWGGEVRETKKTNGKVNERLMYPKWPQVWTSVSFSSTDDASSSSWCVTWKRFPSNDCGQE